MVLSWKKNCKTVNFEQCGRPEITRKSAVELLDETKAYYVKSKSVREQKQVLSVRPLISSQSFHVKNSSSIIPHHFLPNSLNYLNSVEVSPSKSLPPLKINRRSTPVNSDVLQMKLRQLINSEINNNNEDGNVKGHENDVISPPSEYATDSQSFALKNSHSQPNSSIHKSLPNLNYDSPKAAVTTGFSSNFKDSFDDSSGHFTQQSADNSIGSISIKSKTERQHSYGRDSGSSTQHSETSLNKKLVNFRHFPQQKSPSESQPNANVKSISFLKFDEPHPSKLWNRSGFRNVQEKLIRNEEYSNTRKKIHRIKDTRNAIRTNSIDDQSRPILRSKSDISDRYGRDNVISVNKKPSDRSLKEINYFFDYLGLGKEIFDEILSNNGAINSKSVNYLSKDYLHSQKNSNNDSDEQCSDDGLFSSIGSSSNHQYCDFNDRNIETVSIVERNARIIKWLCNCRKSQMALLSRNASFV